MKDLNILGIQMIRESTVYFELIFIYTLIILFYNLILPR